MDNQTIAANGIMPVRERRILRARLIRVQSVTSLPLVVQAGLPVFIFAMLSMAAIDPALAMLMKSHVTGEFARIMRAISDLGIGTGYIAASALGLAGAFFCRRMKLAPRHEAVLARLQRFCLLSLAGFAASGAVVNLTKLLAGRHRPRDLFGQSEYGFAPFKFLHGLDSFPSGHSQTIFVVATVFALAMPKRWRSLGLAASLVAASRVVMTNHYLSDVVVGSYVGIAAVLLIAPFILKDGDATALRY